MRKSLDYRKILETHSTEEEYIRIQRVKECFDVYNQNRILTEEQRQKLDQWYLDWLDAPSTKVIPEKPSWL